jgi:hypothetical protein
VTVCPATEANWEYCKCMAGRMRRWFRRSSTSRCGQNFEESEQERGYLDRAGLEFMREKRGYWRPRPLAQAVGVLYPTLQE